MICGIDEAGRGPLAGPVTAAAVILPDDFPVEQLNDSKKLNEAKRNKLASLIKEQAVSWAVVSLSHKAIDRLNIHHATLEAMRRSYHKMDREASQVYIDGKYCPDLPAPTEAIIKGDSKVPAIMAASILAKTHRDYLMQLIDRKYPQYEFARHKGYPTRRHRELCLQHGISPVHRTSFKITPPVQMELFG